ncbi:MAG: HTH domain-containing protein [Pseudonocardiaceae bacterium]|nr:HTH domain-containing protein [Pseudonocardiaceae bacterium]
MHIPANAQPRAAVGSLENRPSTGTPGSGLNTGAAPAPSEPKASSSAPTVPNRRIASSDRYSVPFCGSERGGGRSTTSVAVPLLFVNPPAVTSSSVSAPVGVTPVTGPKALFAGLPEIRHNSVVKMTGPATSEQADGRTRESVARLLLEHGPITAVAVAEQLGISSTAVRRHLDGLVAEGEATTRDAPRTASRGRGRPAKLFLLTEAGRARFGHAYDDLAVAALRFVAENGGEQAVREFAERRMATLVERHRSKVLAKREPSARAASLAAALTSEGYAASTQHLGSGEQLCQHHCPVAHVAAEFPELCEAETAAFADLLGTHVQRLATIARGDAACTTHVPAQKQAGRQEQTPDGGKPA